MTDVTAFNREIAEFADTLTPAAARTLIRKIGGKVLRGVVFKTPVDTGRARGNWIVSHGEPAQGETGLVDRGSGTDRRATIGEGDLELRKTEVGTTVWISNNVPYIRKLEHGHSGQAPEGMVAVTLAEIEAQFP
jgi:hypothetical protein